MKESVFQSEITAAVRQLLPEWHYYKIPDAPIRSEATFKRVPIYKPYDCYMVKDGRFLALELKMHCTLSGFAFDRLAQHQEDALISVSQSGCTAGILINVRKNKVPPKQQEKFGKSVNFMAWISIKEWMSLQVNDFSDRKSIPIEWFLSRPLFNYEKRDGLWPVDQLRSDINVYWREAISGVPVKEVG